MINYYKILELKNFDSTNLEKLYKNNLKKYINLPFYSIKIKKDINMLKEAFYVLSNTDLKEIYNNNLKKYIKISKGNNLERNVIRNNCNKSICTRNFENFNHETINIEKELELKKSKLFFNKKNSNYINEQ